MSIDEQVRLISDRLDLVALVDRYVIALDTVDTRELDDDFYRTIFTDDAELSFPIGGHSGVAGLAKFQREAKAKWRDTLHVSASHEIELFGDKASVRAHVLGSHLHHEAGLANFDMGGVYEATAVRTPSGWRLHTLSFSVIWTSGPQLPGVKLD